MQAERLIEIKLKEGLLGHAYLLVGGKKILDFQVEKIIKALAVRPENTIRLQTEDKKNGDITIAMIRELKKDLSILSASKRIVLIDQADKLNIQAANAFLKTLEEPPSNTIIILLSQTNDLLPTIRSRCQIYQFSNKKPEFQLLNDGEIEKIHRLSIKQRFDLAEKVAKSNRVPEYLNDFIVYYHQKLMGGGDSIRMLEKLREAEMHFEANVNPKMILENIFLSID